MSVRMSGARWAVVLALAVGTVGGCSASTTGEGSAGESTATVSAGPTALPAGDEATQFCADLSDQEIAVIDGYVEAWNAGDVDALLALVTDPGPQAACQYRAALATGVTLRADYDACVLHLSDEVTVLGGDVLDLRAFDIEAPTDDTTILWAPMIPQLVVGSYAGDDEAVLAFWDCYACDWNEDLYTATQVGVIEDYVAAFNARDLEAIMATFSPEPDIAWPTTEQFRAQHEALLRSGLTLTVDLDHGTFALATADGRALPPGVNGPCLLTYGPFFTFGEDYEGDTLKGTDLASEVLMIDESRHVLDEETRAALQDAMPG
ncbi:hypothetical protein [Demequina rhizosphaerae]|uniref:hypothetical protein n=1 Tax=Demequina rhizosphaerae TaxID=1638985 RepID=UPI0007825B39|nr:hypothetical protein [Demequina rhizosphaerae]